MLLRLLVVPWTHSQDSPSAILAHAHRHVRPDYCAVSRYPTQTVKGVRQSIAPLADTQRRLSKVFAQSIALPDLGFVVSRNNAMIASAIEDIQAVYSAPHIRVQGFDKVFYPGVLRDIRDISASYRMLFSESSTNAAAIRDLTAIQQIWSRMLIPSSTVASFTHSLRSGVALRPEPNSETLPPLSDREDPRNYLICYLPT